MTIWAVYCDWDHDEPLLIEGGYIDREAAERYADSLDINAECRHHVAPEVGS